MDSIFLLCLLISHNISAVHLPEVGSLVLVETECPKQHRLISCDAGTLLVVVALMQQSQPSRGRLYSSCAIISTKAAMDS